MNRHARRIVLLSTAAGLAVFLGVQDRVTAAGARRYVALHRAAPGTRPPETVDDVMRPAVARSVRLGAICGGTVMLTGFGMAAAVSFRRPTSPKRSARGPVSPKRSQGG